MNNKKYKKINLRFNYLIEVAKFFKYFRTNARKYMGYGCG